MAKGDQGIPTNEKLELMNKYCEITDVTGIFKSTKEYWCPVSKDTSLKMHNGSERISYYLKSMKLLFQFLIISNFIKFSETSDLEKRIVKVWGQIESSSKTKARIFENYEECLSKCLGDATCVLIAETSSGCVNFNLTNVPIVEKSNANSGIKIGFKRSLDKCPSITANPPLFGQTTITESYTFDGILYSYNITELKSGSSTKWVFKAPTICPKDSLKLTRGKIDVCVSFRFFPDSEKCQNQEMGVKLCRDSGGSGLTGPYSDEERALFGNSLSTYPSDYLHQNFCIDGKRVDGSNSYTFSDSTLNSRNGYGSVRGANDDCHYLATKGNLVGVVLTQSCTIDANAYFCQRGSICLTPPL